MMPIDPEELHPDARIIRHKPREKPFELAIGNEESLRAIDAHIERHLGKPATVSHEILSDLVHIDVYRPNVCRRRFWMF